MAGKAYGWKKVIDGLRSRSTNTSQAVSAKKIEIEEPLKQEHFQVARVAVHGFPCEPSCIDFDPVQKIVAIGTKTGDIRIFGRPGVEYMLSHQSAAPVIQIIFLVNTGGLISICRDDLVHLWNIRQKTPELVHSLQFKLGQLTCGHVPIGSSWLYIGSEHGNVHFVSVQRFATSGYVLNWNKAIDILQSKHPGRVVKIDSNPTDANKLLVAYSTGFLVLWDLKNKSADARFQYSDNVNDFAWHWEGKTFMTCHNSGLLATWSCRQPQQPVSVICPHAKTDTLPTDCSMYEPIHQVQWLPAKSGEPFVIFSGGCRKDLASVGNPSDPANESDTSGAVPAAATATGESQQLTPHLAVKRGKRLVVSQMDYRLVNFITLCASPYLSENMDAYAVAVLLAKDLVVVDLLSPTYATFENPYPMNLAISPVTACLYLVDSLGDLVPAFYSVGSRLSANRAPLPSDSGGPATATAGSADGGFTNRDWPINGGEWGISYKPYTEILITGHADGSVRFWDASEVTLTPLYKFRTTHCFNTKPTGGKSSEQSCGSDVNAQTSSVLMTSEPDPFAIQLMHFCPESRRLLTASSTHVCLLQFNRHKHTGSVPVLDVHIPGSDESIDLTSAGDAFADEHHSGTMTKETAQQVLTGASHSSHHSGSVSSFHSAFTGDRELRVFVSVLTRASKVWPPGYQPSLVCRLGVPVVTGSEGNTTSSSIHGDLLSVNIPSAITAISLNTANGLLAIGNASGLAIVDYTNQICIFTTPTLDISDVCPQVPGRTLTNSSNDGKGSESQQADILQTTRSDVKSPAQVTPKESTGHVVLGTSRFFGQLSGDQMDDFKVTRTKRHFGKSEMLKAIKPRHKNKEAENSRKSEVLSIEGDCDCHIYVVDLTSTEEKRSIGDIFRVPAILKTSSGYENTVIQDMASLMAISRLTYECEYNRRYLCIACRWLPITVVFAVVLVERRDL